MHKQNSWKRRIIGGAATTAIVASVAAFTLTPSMVNAQNAAQPESQSQAFQMRDRGHGPERSGDRWAGDRQQYLADALNITVDELDAAQAAAMETAIAQAVADGIITQEQADRMAERAGAFGGHPPMHAGRGSLGRGDLARSGADHAALLADELGISVEDLQAAHMEARQAALDQAVADGDLTAEEAALFQARHALRAYLDPDAVLAQLLGMSVEELDAAREAGTNIRELLDEQGLDRTALHEAMQSAHAEALAQAVIDGVITQEQADALAQEGFGGRGGHDRGPNALERGDGVPRGDGQRGSRR